MRNLITVLLLICSVLMTVCGVILYQDITGSPAAEPQQTAAPAPEVSPEDGGAQILVPGQARDGDDAQIVDDSGLPSAADFRMVDREGNTVRLSDFFGKPILMNFWATWCPPCQSELPYFNEAYAQYGDQIQFMMVDLADGVSETQEGCISFAEEKGYHFPLFFDLLALAKNIVIDHLQLKAPYTIGRVFDPAGFLERFKVNRG